MATFTNLTGFTTADLLAELDHRLRCTEKESVTRTILIGKFDGCGETLWLDRHKYEPLEGSAVDQQGTSQLAVSSLRVYGSATLHLLRCVRRALTLPSRSHTLSRTVSQPYTSALSFFCARPTSGLGRAPLLRVFERVPTWTPEPNPQPHHHLLHTQYAARVPLCDHTPPVSLSVQAHPDAARAPSQRGSSATTACATCRRGTCCVPLCATRRRWG